MKFSQYIQEARLQIDPDAFDEFCNIALDDPDEAKEHDVYKYVLDTFGSQKAKAFLNICSMSDTFGINTKALLRILMSVKDTTFDKVVGAGSYGVVFGIKDKVYKFPYKGFTSADIAFYKWQSKAKNRHFPIIYKYTDKYVCMERVEMGTKEVKDFIDWVWGPTFNTKDEENHTIPTHNEREERWAQWIYDVRDALEAMNHPAIGGLGDISANNVGMRGDEMVYFDI